MPFPAAPAGPTADPLRLPVRCAAYSMLGACLLAPPLSAEECAVVSSRANLASMSGQHITSIVIVSGNPDLVGPARLANGLHVASREAVIRRQLLFAPGDTVDTLRMGETMRRLRQQRLFSDVVVQAQHCDTNEGVALVVGTQDAWTLRPTVRLRASNELSFGMEDRNLLGTGRSLSVTREVNLRGTGAAISLSDPFLFGTGIASSIRLADLAGAHTMRLGLRRHEYSVFDRWKIEGNLARVAYRDTSAVEKSKHTISAMSLVGRQVSASTAGVTMLLAGAEFDSASSISPSRRQSAQGMVHVRSYAGLDVGLQRRTAQFDSASWIVPGRRGFLDVPLGWEGEGLVGGGYERDAHSPTMKYDLWLGRVWLPRRGQILMLDGWASAYLGRSVDLNQITRASASWYSEARGGMWGMRLTAEQLAEIDPDRRGLSLMPLADYTTPVLRLYAARGGRSLAGSLERDVHAMHIGAASMLNVGGFLASSYRWNVRGVEDERIGATVAGARLRVLSANGTIGSIRADVGYPVARSALLERKPFLTITYGTLFDVSRQRDGRRQF